MNITVLAYILMAELLGIAVFSIVTYVILGLSKEEVKDNPTREHARNVAVFVERFVLASITVALILWCILQFAYFGAVISISFSKILAGLIVSALFIGAYYKAGIKSSFVFIIIQIIVCIFFADISTCTYSYSREYVNTVEITYSGKEQHFINEDKNTKTFADIYYYNIDDTENPRSFTSLDYDVELYYDVEEGEPEYYEQYNHKMTGKINGLGCYYTLDLDKPLILLHVQQ